jgi:hypothetical protein
VRAALVAALCALPSAVVVLAAGPAGADPITDEATLRAQFAAATGTIEIQGFIDLTCGGGGALTRNSASPITVHGSGFDRINQTCDTADVVDLQGTGAVTFQGVALTGGPSTGNGIATVAADVTLDNSPIVGVGGNGIDVAQSADVTVLDASISSVGGDGISTFGGTVTLTDSAIEHSGGDGIASDADVTITRSTISENDGNGVDSNGVNRMVNSTVTANQGTGVATDNSFTIVYSTIVNNDLAHSNGFDIAYNGGGSYSFFGTVIAIAGSGTSCEAGAKTSHGFNFADDGSCGLDQPTDIPAGGNPALGPPTSGAIPVGVTCIDFCPPVGLRPLAGSPLIDAIPIASCQADGAAGVTTDEFGRDRPLGTGCDIGAVEIEPPRPPEPPPVVAPPAFTG